MGLQHDLAGGAYRLSVEPYFARIANQVEYKGNVLGILTDKYDLNEILVTGPRISNPSSKPSQWLRAMRPKKL